MKSFRMVCMALVMALVAPVWAAPKHTPEQLVAWRDSMELMYRRDVQQMDMQPLRAELVAESDAATKGVMLMLLAQCYEVQGSYYAHRSDGSRRADEAQRTARELYEAAWALRDALAQEPAARWMGLMRDTTADAADMCLLEVCYPAILDGMGTLDSWEKGAHLSELATTLRQYGRVDAAVDAECGAIRASETSDADRYAGLSALLEREIDTRAAGRVLGAMVPYMSGAVRDKVAYVEQTLTRLRPDADTALVHRQLMTWMKPVMKPIMLQDTLRAYCMSHIREATVRLYRAELKNKYEYEWVSNLRRGELVAEEVLRPRYEGRDWRVEMDTVVVSMRPQPGLYLMEVTSGTDTVRSCVRVSTVDMLIEEPDGISRLRYRVVSPMDGSTVEGARIRHRWNPQQMVREVCAYRTKDDRTEWWEDENWDVYIIASRIRQKQREIRNKHHRYPTGEVMTDRAIYRPGQTVEIAAVYGRGRADGHHRVKAHKRVHLMVYNGEHRTVLDTTLRTDKLGRVALSYALPEDVKPGSRYMFYLRNGISHIASVSVLVDNYRRPQATLTTRYDVVGDSCLLWATVHTAGGEAVGEMEAVCTLGRDTCAGQETAPGEMRFYMGSLSTHKAQKDWALSPSIRITLPSGETLTGSEYIYLRQWPYQLAYEENELIVGRDTAITITARDGNYRHLRVPVRLELTSGDNSYTLTGITSEPMLLPRDLKTGTYHLRAISEADTLLYELWVVSPDYPAGYVDDMSVFISASTLTSEGADIYILSPYPNIPVEVRVYYGRHTDNYQVTCRDNLGVLHLTPNAHMTREVLVEAYVVHNGEVLYEVEFLTVPAKEDDRLTLGLKHFSDHTAPGSHERWTLTVSDHQGQPVSGAAVVATMYDGSLDQLASMPSWSIHTSTYRPHYRYREYDLQDGLWSLPTLSPRWTIPVQKQQALSWQGFAPNQYSEILTARFEAALAGQPGTNATVKVRGVSSLSSAGIYGARGSVAGLKIENAMETDAVFGLDAVLLEDEEEIDPMFSVKPKVDASVWLRRDFRELALWSATGVTNLKGELPMETTLPDQLSRWHLCVLAYDKHLRQGTLDTLMLVEQQLTLQPLWPRFVRPGDAVEVLSEARNRTDEALSFTTTLEVRSADSTRVLYRWSEPLTLQPRETRRLMAPMPVAADWGDSVRIAWTISNDRMGDGEQQWVAVQPRETVLLPDTTIRRSPEEVLREQLHRMRLGDCHDALRVALALYVAKQEGRHDVQAELRLKRVVQKDGGIAWCPGMGSSPWVTMQVLDLLLREGRHPEVVEAAMMYLDTQREKMMRDVDLSKARSLTDNDIHYLVLSAQVARTRSARVDSIVWSMDAGLRRHVLALSSVRESAHTPLTIFGVSEIGCALPDNGTPLRATAAEHVLRLSLVRPEWGRYFKEEGYNCRIQTQLSAIHLMDTVGRTREADELRRWLMGQVWSRAWQNPVLIWQGLEQVTGNREQITDYAADFSSQGLVSLETEWEHADSLSVGEETTLRVTLSAETELDLVRITIPLPACVEPARALSGYRYIGGVWVYVAQHDDRVELYLHRLGVGYRELALPMRVLRGGTYTIPEATLTSDYWPEIYIHTTKATMRPLS